MVQNIMPGRVASLIETEEIYDLGLPDVIRCPVCRAKVAHLSNDAVKKHLIKCFTCLNPKKYSSRSPGRPSLVEVEEHLRTLRYEE